MDEGRAPPPHFSRSTLRHSSFFFKVMHPVCVVPLSHSDGGSTRTDALSWDSVCERESGRFKFPPRLNSLALAGSRASCPRVTPPNGCCDELHRALRAPYVQNHVRDRTTLARRSSLRFVVSRGSEVTQQFVARFVEVGICTSKDYCATTRTGAPRRVILLVLVREIAYAGSRKH